MAGHRAQNPKRVHPYAWLWERLEDDPTFVLRSMFGAKAAYLGGRLMLCFCASEEPWFGVLVCTSRAHHESLIRDFPALVPHPALSKWLYLSDRADEFETMAPRLVILAQRRDLRLGVEPNKRKSTGGIRKKTKRRIERPR